MRFLNALCGRPAHEKPVMILPAGWPAADATVPAAARRKTGRDAILTLFRPKGSASPAAGAPLRRVGSAGPRPRPHPVAPSLSLKPPARGAPSGRSQAWAA
jgi:hypothetical protein